MWVFVLLLPLSDFLAGLVAVFVGHVKIAQYDRIVTIWLREDLLCALDAIKHRVDLNVHLCQEFEDNLDKMHALVLATKPLAQLFKDLLLRKGDLLSAILVPRDGFKGLNTNKSLRSFASLSYWYRGANSMILRRCARSVMTTTVHPLALFHMLMSSDLMRNILWEGLVDMLNRGLSTVPKRTQDQNRKQRRQAPDLVDSEGDGEPSDGSVRFTCGPLKTGSVWKEEADDRSERRLLVLAAEATEGSELAEDPASGDGTGDCPGKRLSLTTSSSEWLHRLGWEVEVEGHRSQPCHRRVAESIASKSPNLSASFSVKPRPRILVFTSHTASNENLTRFRKLDGVPHDLKTLVDRHCGSQIIDFFDEGPYVEPVHVERNHASFRFGQVENVIDKSPQTFCASSNDVDVLHLLSRETTVDEEVDHACDPIQRRSNLVRHVTQESRFLIHGLFQIAFEGFVIIYLAAHARGAIGEDSVLPKALSVSDEPLLDVAEKDLVRLNSGGRDCGTLVIRVDVVHEPDAKSLSLTLTGEVQPLRVAEISLHNLLSLVFERSSADIEPSIGTVEPFQSHLLLQLLSCTQRSMPARKELGLVVWVYGLPRVVYHLSWLLTSVDQEFRVYPGQLPGLRLCGKNLNGHRVDDGP
ncbi:hypothetical protein KC345_g305 [Hortaea werneckii]|nr:hypothetical protein KC345_g305 [Hortaea werneckii]